MLARFHREITQAALKNQFSPGALETIIQANLHQDDLKYLFCGYPHHHFDDSAFERAYAYLDEQRQIILETLTHSPESIPAWEAFGRITHALQDFYAHSNYIHLWLEPHTGDKAPNPAEVEPLLPDILASPRLITARSLLSLEILGRIPFLGKMLIPLFPPDTHIRMNLDQPASGPLFPYVLVAARKRTEKEFEALSQQIQVKHGSQALQKFVDQ
ncbi:MAG TPA: hypothetical protein VI451_00870 [Anaerolineales bacterium]|nr:hypothetical protein [Anaerolineales bacterium]